MYFYDTTHYQKLATCNEIQVAEKPGISFVYFDQSCAFLRMQISYSTGWNIIRILESQLACSLVVRSQGGTNGGQSMLTEYGRQLLSQYRGFKDELQRNVDNLYKKYFGDVF